MSASPLPAFSTISAAPPTTSAPSPSTGQTSPNNDGSAFNARLQSAQQQAAPSPSGTPSKSQPSTTQSNGQANAKPVTASAANSASASSSNNNQSVDSTSDDSNATSLASTVLGLIDQSAGDKNAAATNTSSSDKATASKTAAATDGTAQATVPQTPMVATAIPVPPQLQVQLNAQVQSQGAAGTSAGALQATSAANASTTPPGLTLGKLTGSFSATDAADTADDADASDSSDEGDNAASSLLVQSAGDATQLTISSLLGTSHAASAATSMAPTADSASQSGTDLAALRGILNTPPLTTPPTGDTATHSLNINAPVNSSGFAQELGQQVAWLGGQEVKQAQIRLNPQDLGQLDVKVSVEHGRVDVVFMAQHPAAVTAVQQSLGQLNQMLTGQGLSLGQTMVGQQSAQQQFSGSQGQSTASASAAGVEDESVDALAGVSSQPVAVGLVDAFA